MKSKSSSVGCGLQKVKECPHYDNARLTSVECRPFSQNVSLQSGDESQNVTTSDNRNLTDRKCKSTIVQRKTAVDNSPQTTHVDFSKPQKQAIIRANIK